LTDCHYHSRQTDANQRWEKELQKSLSIIFSFTLKKMFQLTSPPLLLNKKLKRNDQSCNEVLAGNKPAKQSRLVMHVDSPSPKDLKTCTE
jgi:hypothetical protein